MPKFSSIRTHCECVCVHLMQTRFSSQVFSDRLILCFNPTANADSHSQKEFVPSVRYTYIHIIIPSVCVCVCGGVHVQSQYATRFNKFCTCNLYAEYTGNTEKTLFFRTKLLHCVKFDSTFMGLSDSDKVVAKSFIHIMIIRCRELIHSHALLLALDFQSDIRSFLSRFDFH